MLSQDKLRSIGVGALVAGAGAGLVYLGQYFTGCTECGSWGPILAALCAVGVNALRKLATPTETQP